MEEKLQTIIDKVYQEGIEKSQQEADEILQKANEKAQTILDRAQQHEQQTKVGVDRNQAVFCLSLESLRW